MNVKNKALAALAAGASLLVAACSGGGASGGTAANAPVELTMYYPVAVGGPLTKVVDKLVADFHTQHPMITVKAVYSGSYADTLTKAVTAARSGAPPDLAVLQASDLYTLEDQKLIVPFDDLASGDPAGGAWLSGFYPPLLENSRDGGKTWGVPFQRSTIVQYYNKDAFTKAGLDPGAPPATWQQLVDDGKKIVASGAAPAGVEIPSTDFPYWMLQALTEQSGGQLVNDTGTQTSFNAAQVQQALQFWFDLGHTDHVMPPGLVNWSTTPTDFLSGKTAIMWTSTGNLTNVRQKAKFTFGVSALPANTEPGSPVGGGNLYVFAHTDAAHQHAAYQLAHWLADPAQAAAWSVASGYVGTSPAAYETPTLKEYVAGFPAALVARDQLAHAHKELATHANAQVYKIINDAVQRSISGQSSVADALNAAQADADQILTQYR